MNRFSSVFLAVASSCTLALAQTTNIVDATLTGSGSYPTNYAANIENVAGLQVSGTTLTGGAGGTTTETGTIITESGGSGLRVDNTGSTTISDTKLQGGAGGTITVDTSSTPEANAGHGLHLSASSGHSTDLHLTSGVSATGGDGGAIDNQNGKAKAFGGDGVHIEFSNPAVDSTPANMVVDGGTYQGGKGGSAKFNSNVKESFLSTILSGAQNGARGGHGLYAFEGFMFRDAARSLTITNGSFTGGAGGTAVNSDVGDVIANGGSGVYVGSVSDVNISGGTFVGGAAGSTNGVAASGGYGATFWDSNVGISGGDFGGGAGGLLFGSIYYDSVANISGGRFDSAEFRTITTDVTGFQGKTTANISGGDFGKVTLSGAEEVDAAITGGTIGSLVFNDGGTRNVTLGNAAAVSAVAQNGGTANITQWSDDHFRDTTINGGTMNFSGRGFNLTDGSSLELTDPTAKVDFKDGFTARSGSQITSTYDGTTHSTITNGAMDFQAGAKWTVNGVSTINNGDSITMASGSSMTSGILDSDVDYVGGSWAAGLTLGVVGNNLIGTYGYRSLEVALGLDPNDGGFGTAMKQLSDATDFVNSSSNQFVALKDPNLSQEAASDILQGQFANNPMVGAMMQLQGLFADQIRDRSRSYLRHKNWGRSASQAPMGAQGPGGWNRGMDQLNSSLPKWDARGSLKDLDRSAPSLDLDGTLKAADARAPKWDARESMKQLDEKAPRPSSDRIEVPSTYQVWGRGYGSYFKQDSTGDRVGFDTVIGGATLGLDKRLDKLLLGVGGGYANTRLADDGGGLDRADTLYGTAYATVDGEKGFVDFNINYAYNDVTTKGSAVSGSYESDYDASTFSIYFGGGYALETVKDFLFTPEASLLTTYYTRGSYTETAKSTDPWPTLNWDSYDQWSYLSSLGATLSTFRLIDSMSLKMGFQPELRAHWLHEFNADMDNDSYIMAGNTTPVGVAVQAREEDLIRVGGGVRFSSWDSDTLSFGLDLDGVFGSDYEAYIVSGKLMHRF